MADAEYIFGTNEFVVVKLERTALSADFDAAEWTYELVLVPINTVFVLAEAIWTDAIYELATDELGKTHHTVKARLPLLTEAVGRYTPRVRMTAIGDEIETPTLIEAEGMVIVKL